VCSGVVLCFKRGHRYSRQPVSPTTAPVHSHLGTVESAPSYDLLTWRKAGGEASKGRVNEVAAALVIALIAASLLPDDA